MLKWIDYSANVFEVPISFLGLAHFLPSPPLKCLKTIMPELPPKDALDVVHSWISDMPDPFSGHRLCGLSEAETVACAIPSYLINKRYKMGDDIRKYREQLKDYPDMLRLLP